MARSLASRLGTYQAERFPLAAYVPLVAVAALAALAYSRALRGTTAMPPPGPFLVAILTLLVLFFLLRVFDEHKDARDDARWRPELPVPRGLVTLSELRGAAGVSLVIAVAANAALDPALLGPLALVVGYAWLMRKEFFAPDWLRTRPLAYLLSHMVVMPLVLLHASALDWLAAGADPPSGLWILLAMSFANGLVIEIGRKLRPAEEEREGVDTYTAVWGLRTAVGAWVASVATAAVLLAFAATRVGGLLPAVLAALLLGAFAVVPAIRLVRSAPGVTGKSLETASGVWVLGSYFMLAALPFLPAAWGGAGG
jgi:4-hydroxybenzoate polyprenyltransferase